MKFLTLSINPPERIAPILGMSESIYGKSYQVINLDPKMSDIDSVINALQSNSLTHWTYIEAEPMTSEQYEAEANVDHLTSEQFPNV